jgi:APA family basic amino acid/polyamine antiporter
MSHFRDWLLGLKHDITRTIDVEEPHHGAGELNRQLGLFSIFLFTLTQAVGAGILTTPGIIAGRYTGGQAWEAFLIAGLVCAPAALCLAKMASFTAKSGSTGSYACLVLGQFVGLLMFIDVMLECVGGTAAVAVSQADHIKLILRLTGGMELPEALTHTPDHAQWLMLAVAVVGSGIGALIWRTGRRDLRAATSAFERIVSSLTIVLASAPCLVAGGAAALFVITLPSGNLLAVGVVAVATAILLRGINETKWVSNPLTVLKVLVIGALICIFAGHFSWDNINRPATTPLLGVKHGAAAAIFAFVGFDLATTASGETKNPKRNVPLGMLLALVAVTVFYVAVAFFMCGAVPYDMLYQPGNEAAAPMARALEILGYSRGAVWVAGASTLALMSVVLTTMYSTTRLLYNIAQHHMLPQSLAAVSSKRQVPVNATLLVALVVASLALLLDVDELMHLTNVGTMTAFITVSLTVLVKTLKETRWSNGWRDKFGGVFWVVVAVLGVAGSGWLITGLPWTALARLLVVWSSVTVLFIVYSRHQVRRFVTAN